MVPLANVLLMYCNVVPGPCFSGQKLPLTVIVFRAAMVACLVNHSFFSEQLTVCDYHDLQTLKSAQIRIKACKEEEIMPFEKKVASTPYINPIRAGGALSP